MLGKAGKYSIDAFIIIVQSGLCVTYLLFNGVQIDQILCLTTNGAVCGHKVTYILIATITLLPICYIQHLKHLAYVSV